MAPLVVLLIAFAAPLTQAAIVDEFNCTTRSGADFVYAPSATICNNVYSDAACAALYAPADPAATPDIYPVAGGNAGRPFACYNTAGAAGAPEPDMVRAAVGSCPKTCGFCCMTSEYNCRNVQFPRLNCATITATQCRSATWRTIIAEDCPSACGFCNEGGCVDGVLDCANDLSICTAVGMQDFVNTYCQKTCARCASSTAAPATGGGGCTTYIRDSSTACASWAANGFCGNNFYTVAQRRQYCATTCRIC
uniref:ShKT domain-containing protein n=1 Tax=Caenorhabditis tropicalis TaxID=1561998 RepID=A0A1I7U9M3_9PELO